MKVASRVVDGGLVWRLMAFIRRGAWCECERSCNVHTTQLERALSAYECEPSGDKRWRAWGRAWVKEAAFLRRNDGPWFLVGGYPDRGYRGGDGEPLLCHVWLIAELKLRDPKADSFIEVATHSRAIANHRGFTDGTCVCQSRVEVLEELSRAGEEVDSEELFETLSGAEVPWCELKPEEQRYYQDNDVDKSTVSVIQYVLNLTRQ